MTKRALIAIEVLKNRGWTIDKETRCKACNCFFDYEAGDPDNLNYCPKCGLKIPYDRSVILTLEAALAAVLDTKATNDPDFSGIE